jgi:hypothetical protein
MTEKRRPIGALEAASGVLMFGLTTSALFLVLSDLMNRAWEQRKKAGQNPAETTPT